MRVMTRLKVNPDIIPTLFFEKYLPKIYTIKYIIYLTLTASGVYLHAAEESIHQPRYLWNF